MEKIANLLKKISKGDENAFCELYKVKYSQSIIYAKCILGDRRNEAEDVVSDAFISIWKSAHNYNQTGSAEGWINRIIRNKSIDLLRKKYDTPIDNSQIIEKSDIATYFEQQSQINIDNFNKNELYEAMLRLSIEQREALHLFYFEDLSISTISEICDCSQNTIKTRLFYAKKKLREIIFKSEKE